MSYPRIKFLDDSVKDNQTYFYRVAGIDFFGNETRSTGYLPVRIKDLTPPSAPVKLQKRIQKLNVWLTWQNTEEKELAGFNVYRSQNDSSGFVKINPQLVPPGSALFLDNVPHTGGYYYYVTATDSAGNEGRSGKIFADVADLFPPEPPTGLIAKADTGKIRLCWKANRETDLAGYMIYRTINTDDLKKYTLLNAEAITDTFFVDVLPKNIKNRMVYRVAAIDTSLNKGKYSEPVSVTMPDVLPPAQPFIKNVTEKDHNLVVEWIPNVEPDLYGYEIFRATGKVTRTFEKINEGILSANVDRFTDRNAEPDSVYYYVLVALDSSANRSVQSHWFSGTVARQAQDGNLSSIIVFKAKMQKNSVKLLWKTNNAGSFVGYAIYRDEDGFVSKLAGLFPGTSYTDKAPPIHARYQLRLYHANGTVVKSDWITPDAK
jgi:uncharacterized protein